MAWIFTPGHFFGIMQRFTKSKKMQNQNKILITTGIIALSTLFTVQIVLAGPSDNPASGNLPDARFNTVTVNNTAGAEGINVTTNNTGYAGRFINNSSTGLGAISALSLNPNGYGVVGYNATSTGNGIGVYGYSLMNTGLFGFSAGGKAVFGQAGAAISAIGAYFSKTGSNNNATLASSNAALSTNGNVEFNNGKFYIQNVIANRDPGTPVVVEDSEGIEISTGTGLSSNLYIKPSTTFGINAEIGFKDPSENDYFQISGSKGLELRPNQISDPNSVIRIINSYYKPSVTAPKIDIIASDFSQAPLNVEGGIETDGNLKIGGTASKPGGGAWLTSSDIRLKDIHSTFTRGLEDLMKIQPISYNYKKDNVKGLPSDHTYIGVIAQEIQKAVPEAVSEGSDGYLVVNNDPIIWTMLNAVKELKYNTSAEIDKLRAENNDLKKRLEQLENKLK